MKKILYFVLFFPIMVIGQTTSENYVRTKTYKTETMTSIASPTISQVNQSITYFDGLGRPIQQVENQQSASGNSIVTPIEYDAFGRQVKEYLPYATNAASLNYVSSALTAVGTFFNTTAYENTTNPFSLKELEASSLNRVLKQAAPGNDWSMANNHVIRFDYQTNTNADAVKHFIVDNVTWNASKGLYDIPTSLTPASYSEFQLYKTITKDENWKITDGVNNTTEEFKDKQGRVVLKRTYNNGIKHDTYYVYDQFGNLTFVLPPLVNTTVTISNTTLEGLCYQYKYDNRKRLVEKKLPGKQWEFIVYDKLDRVVATGPALSPFASPTGNGWMITKYDVFNRPILTAWQPSTTVTSAGRKTFQDNYHLATTVVNEVKTIVDSPPVSGVAFRYTNEALPTTGYHVLTVNYYDDYNFPNAPTIPTSVEGQPVFYNNIDKKPKGLLTGTYVRVPETISQYKSETSYTLYDEKARPIRNYTTNYLGGFTQVDSKFDWAGKTLYTLTTHKRIASSAVTTVKDAFEYTPQDRLLKHTHQINGGVIQLLAKNEYDELGQLIVKRVGGTDLTGTNPLQKVDYNYNIRGWLKGINDTNSLSGDLFSFKINYNTVENTISNAISPLYNGNIAETKWRTSSDNVLRRYGYQYDNLNRLTNAIYQKPNNAVPVTNSYNESLTYDKNGNITALQRNGEYDDAMDVLQIDNLTYSYNTSIPNQLLSVFDTTNNPKGFSDGATLSTDVDFQYDANGNMIKDKNKNMDITYNHLNLPLKITFASLNYIEYLYNAVGQKVKKVVKNGSVTTTTDYLSGYQYVNNVLEFFPTAEGYVKNTVISGVNNYNYIYNYTDHLGNIRLSYTFDTATSSLKTVEENNYYPFGLKQNGFNMTKRTYQEIESGVITVRPTERLSYQYKFQGQEFQDELGLNWYSFKWRNEDPVIGRFMSVDPLSEVYEWQSVYAFGSNQPVHAKELEGMESDKDLSGNNRTFKEVLSGIGDGIKNFVDTVTSLDTYVMKVSDAKKEIAEQKSKGATSTDIFLNSIGMVKKSEIPKNLSTRKVASEITQSVLTVGTVSALSNVKISKSKTSANVSAAASEASAARVGANTVAASSELTTVGRWMSEAEYNTMANTGQMVEGAGGQTFVSTGGSTSFTAATKGSVYAEFQVPSNSLLQGGQANWFKTIGPSAGNAMQSALTKQGGQVLPKIQNLSPILEVKQ